jgi:exopolysaccharide biosynthesis polyprenyl glycosylphosphotransferase
MYVGGLGAAAGSTTARVADVATLTLAGAATSHHDHFEPGARAASGAARARQAGRIGAGDDVRQHTSRRRRSVVAAQLMAIDLAASAFGVIGAFLLRFGTGAGSSAIASVDVLAVVLPLAWVSASALNRAYDLRFTGVGTTEFGRIFRTFLQLTVITAFVSYAAHLDIARGFVLLALPLALVLTWSGRYAARLRLHRMRRAGRAMNRVLAVGTADSVQHLAASMTQDSSAGLHVVGACLPPCEADDPGVHHRLAEHGIEVLGDFESVRESAEGGGARSVAVVAGDVGTNSLRAISWELEGSGIDLIVSSGLSEVAGPRVHVQTVAGLPLLRVDEPEFGGFRRVLKGTFDRSLAALALIVLSPVLLGLGLVIRCTSRGPALYRQIRVGRNGQQFSMVKFRSMRVGADEQVAMLATQNEAANVMLFKIREDPRVTPVGKILRRFSLDELPQLLNVLTGSMSLVGPRPPLPAEVAKYHDDVHRRLLVKPGLTGLWQVSGRSDLSWEESVRLDLHYVENWSLGLDLAVLLKTARVVVKATGAY